MDWKAVKNRFASSRRTTTAAFRLPSLVLEIQSNFVMSARLDGSARRVRRISTRALEAGCLDPAPGRSNVLSNEPLREALLRSFQTVGNGSGGMGLLVSDAAVRVAVLSFETLPESETELDDLIRWRMKQNLSYPAEEARLSYQVAPLEPEGFEVLVLAIKGSVASEYESLVEETNGGFELILPVTAALLPLLPSEAGPQLVLSICSGWMTSVVVCGKRVCFWRSRSMVHGGGEDAHRAVITEAARVLASARDHLHLETMRVWLCVRPSVPPEFAGEVGNAISQEVSTLSADPGLAGALQQQERSIFNDLGAPLGGLLMNG
jgi:hypothetical protein